MDFIPQNRLKIFISSAQNSENGFEWSPLRKKIKTTLSVCPYLNPFIIEDAPSGTPSRESFTFHVETSDIVVMLIKGELRQGTSLEFSVAKKAKKRFLIYFIEECSPQIDVVRLKKEIEKNDYCTYCGHIAPTEDIAVKIYHDIINDVVHFFQYESYSKSRMTEENSLLPSSSELTDFKSGVMNKASLSDFKSCYNYIYELIGYHYLKSEDTKDKTFFDTLGKKLIKWLITGETFYDLNELSKFVDKEQEIYSNTHWLAKRLDTIGKFLDGKTDEALILEEQAFAIAQESNMPEWILNDILIECRNFEDILNRAKGIFTYGKYQQKLNESSSFVYLPLCDRFLEQVYSETIKEEIKLQTQSPYTVTFGTKLSQIINNIENDLFVSLSYGSYIHLIISRQVLAQVLYKYGKLVEDQNMICISLSLFLLNGETKEFSQILLKEWDFLYSSLTVKADYFWVLVNNINTVYKDAIKITCLEYLGLYFSDDIFSEAELYLYEYSNVVTWQNGEEYFNCIDKNIARLNHEKLINAIIPIISEGRFNLGSSITKVLFNINIKDISDDVLTKLRDALYEKMQMIISRNGEPQFIAYFVKMRPDIFLPLAEHPNNGLTGIQKIYYELNLGNEKWETILEFVIIEASKQYEANKTKSTYIGFPIRPFDIIARIMDIYYVPGMDSYITNKFFPICVNVLTNSVALPLKDDCLNSLCSITARYIKMGIEIPQDILDAIAICDVSAERNIPLLTNSTPETVKLRLTTLKVILGIENVNILFSWCFEYSKKDINDKVVLAKCILTLLRKFNALSQEIGSIILSTVFQMSVDDYYSLRAMSIECLALLLDSKYNNLAKEKLYDLALDTSPYVCTTLIRICSNDTFPDKSVAYEIINSLSRSVNYAIKNFAIERLKQFE